MAFKFTLLALALVVAVGAEYDYTRSTSNNNQKVDAVSNDVNSLEQHDSSSSSSEEYRTNYQAPETNNQNSQATPKGYDYPSQLSNSDSNVLHPVSNPVAASSSLFPVPLPVLREERQPEVFPPASYSFNYAVNDESTGDIKDHSETRDGYVVRGSYSLIDPDGYKRTVTYTADDVHGFNAIVNRVPYVLKKVALVSPTVVLDERSPVGTLLSAGSSSSASVKDGENTLTSGSGSVSVSDSGDSYVNAANQRDTAGGIYA
ncbi:cuticle protein 19.8 [Drosophila albomicans]|uniref:Cuticle protein 19.8 n=1 Tax=Drosophila albomicans TaxID=7291 RepID=A0A9C6T0Y8_DROAB|nr:cuticle protein 19.8 [Drosophila albomicans]